MLGRVELSQGKIPLLTREDPADEHNLDYVDKLEFLACIFRIHFWSPSSSTDEPHNKPFSFQEVSRVGNPDRNSGATAHLASRGSVM